MLMTNSSIPDTPSALHNPPERVPGVLFGEALRHVLDVELARSRRYDSSFVLLRVGLVGDAAANDTRRKLAGALRSATRWADTVGAEDDGTLIVILRETDALGASAVVAKIQARVAEELMESGTSQVRIEKAIWRKGDDLASLQARFA